MAKKEKTEDGGGEKNELALADFRIMQTPGAMISDLVQENVGGAGVNAGDLDRIKMPSGGGRFFEVQTLEGVEPQKEIRCIILHMRDARAYWKDALDEGGGGNPPDCYSDDGFKGVGTPGGACASCVFSKFGSDKRGRGQACKQIKLLLIVLPDDIIPRIFALPPTSLNAFKKYGLRLSSRLKIYHQVVTRISLEEKENPDRIKYCVAVPSMDRVIPEDQLPSILELRNGMKAIFDSQRATNDDFSGGEGGAAADQSSGSKVAMEPESTDDGE